VSSRGAQWRKNPSDHDFVRAVVLSIGRRLARVIGVTPDFGAIPA